MKILQREVWLAAAILVLFVAPGFAMNAEGIDAAKREGHVTWYTTQIVNQFVRPAAAAFEKKYGIKVDFVRGDSVDVVLRIVNESKAGKVQADVFDGTSSGALIRDGYALKWQPESAQRLPPEDVDPNGYWTATNLYVHAGGYNTSLVPLGSEPKTYEDLLDPKWKGRMVISSGTSATAAPGFVGLILTSMGQDKGMDYLRRLANQNVTPLAVSARQVVDQLAAGEYAVALHVNNDHVRISQLQGAPVDWIRLQPAVAFLSIVSVTKEAPHPNAGKLLVDFLISPEGQALYRDADYMPSDPAVPPSDPSLRPDGINFRAIYFKPDAADSAMKDWWKIFNDLFR